VLLVGWFLAMCSIIVACSSEVVAGRAGYLPSCDSVGI
jgi:hypothetical protein